MSEKLCIFCTKMKFRYEPGSDCETCGYPSEFELKCRAGHDKEWDKPEDEAEFRAIIVQAADCPDYDQVKP